VTADTLNVPPGGCSSVGRAPAWHAGGPRVRAPSPPPRDHRSIGFMLGGVVAGEGSFTCTAATPPTRKDGSARIRFVFSISMASRDRELITALHEFLGVGSVAEIPSPNGRWLPQTRLSVGSRLAHRVATIPFADEFLMPCAKRDQFERWRNQFEQYERLHPTRIGFGPSTCAEDGCDKPVRGRGLCRSHYYRATGY
jgi:hypothetical protein